MPTGRKEVLFNDALNTSYLQLYDIGHMVKDHSDSERGNPSCHMGFSFQLAARVLLHAPSHRQDSTYHSLCYTSRGALAGTHKFNDHAYINLICFQLEANELICPPSHREHNTYGFLTQVLEYWLEWEKAKLVHQEGSV